MNIAIVNTLTIPSGQASVNRILSLGKGLVENGDKVTILSSEKGIDMRFHDIYGIQYSNLSTSSIRIVGLMQSLSRILKYIFINRTDIDVIWAVTNSPLLILPLWFMCKVCNIKYIMEKSEYPFVLMKKGWIARIWGKMYVNIIYKLFDGMIIMTQPLLEYFKNLVRKDCTLIKIPMTVDMSRFENVSRSNEYGEYAAYCGNMSGNKDGVENLIDAFTYIEPCHQNFKLVLVGGANTQEEFDRIKQKVNSLNLTNVVFVGPVPRDEIPGILMNAKILCLARPSSLQSTGGFPTKLGEYLTTGHPVVVTAVGEIPYYLNQSNSYLVEPDNNKLFGETINAILSNYDRAVLIGQEGKKVAQQHFNYKVQSARLHDFLNKLLTY